MSTPSHACSPSLQGGPCTQVSSTYATENTSEPNSRSTILNFLLIKNFFSSTKWEMVVTLPGITSRNLVIHANWTLLVIIFISSKQIDPSNCDRRVIHQWSIPKIKKILYTIYKMHLPKSGCLLHQMHILKKGINFI